MMALLKLQYSTAITTAINEAELGEDAEKARFVTFCITLVLTPRYSKFTMRLICNVISLQ
jgi:hypothetical protein